MLEAVEKTYKPDITTHPQMGTPQSVLQSVLKATRSELTNFVTAEANLKDVSRDEGNVR